MLRVLGLVVAQEQPALTMVATVALELMLAQVLPVAPPFKPATTLTSVRCYPGQPGVFHPVPGQRI